MEPDKQQTTDYIAYVDGVPIGTIGTALPTVTLSPGDDEEVSRSIKDMPLTFHFTVTRWTSCRTRSRFIKLMGGVFGIQRNTARRLADEAMAHGCHSYMDLWAGCFIYLIRYALLHT